VTGVINCQASIIGGSVTGSTTVTVVGDPTTAVLRTPAVKAAPFVPASAVYRTVTGLVMIPEGVAKGSEISVYDLKGTLLHRFEAREALMSIDIRGVIGASKTVHIVRIIKR
jgi:hypothetical protein